MGVNFNIEMYDSVRFSVTFNQKGGHSTAHLDMHLKTTCLEIKRAAIEKVLLLVSVYLV